MSNTVKKLYDYGGGGGGGGKKKKKIANSSRKGRRGLYCVIYDKDK